MIDKLAEKAERWSSVRSGITKQPRL